MVRTLTSLFFFTLYRGRVQKHPTTPDYRATCPPRSPFPQEMRRVTGPRVVPHRIELPRSPIPADTPRMNTNDRVYCPQPPPTPLYHYLEPRHTIDFLEGRLLLRDFAYHRDREDAKGDRMEGRSDVSTAGGVVGEEIMIGPKGPPMLTVDVTNSIIAGNTGIPSDVWGTFVDSGYNIIGDATQSEGFIRA